MAWEQRSAKRHPSPYSVAPGTIPGIVFKRKPLSLIFGIESIRWRV